MVGLRTFTISISLWFFLPSWVESQMGIRTLDGNLMVSVLEFAIGSAWTATEFLVKMILVLVQCIYAVFFFSVLFFFFCTTPSIQFQLSHPWQKEIKSVVYNSFATWVFLVSAMVIFRFWIWTWMPWPLTSLSSSKPSVVET